MVQLGYADAALAKDDRNRTMDSISDEALMLRFQQDDKAAFNALYLRYKGSLYRFFIRQCAANVCDDLYQDVWAKLIKARKRYQPRAKFSTYLFHIAHNRLIDHFRSHQREQLTSFETGFEQRDERDSNQHQGREEKLAADQRLPEQQLEHQRLTQALQGAIVALPAAQREVFLLKEEAGFTVQEISEVTGDSFEAVKSRYRYALKRLRSQLQGSSFASLEEGS